MRTIGSAAGVCAVAAGLAVLLAGCGGSSNTSSTAGYRVADAIPNGGSATTTTTAGSVITTPFQVTSYANIGQGMSNVSFTLSGEPGTVYPAQMINLASGFDYSFFLMGRADVASTDPRYPKLVLTGDNRTPPVSGDFQFRIAHAAPDAGNVDVYVNGTLEQADVPYSTVDPYVSEVQGANNTVEIRQAGTSNDVVAPTTIATSAGHIYTLILTETSVSGPTYSVQLVTDL